MSAWYVRSVSSKAYELIYWILPCVIKRMEMNTHPTQFVRVPPLLTLSAKGEFSDIQKDCKDAGTVFINRCCAPTAGFQRFMVGSPRLITPTSSSQVKR